MKKLFIALSAAAMLGLAGTANAWWGGPWGGWGPWDGWGDGWGDLDFSVGMRGRGYGRGYGYPGYWGGYPYYGYPGYWGGYPYYGGPGYWGRPYYGYGYAPPPAAPAQSGGSSDQK